MRAGGFLQHPFPLGPKSSPLGHGTEGTALALLGAIQSLELSIMSSDTPGGVGLSSGYHYIQ